MRKFYQTNWFGIDFASFTKLDSKKIADASFYNKFYTEFYKRFKSYDDLPENWKTTKKAVADLILQNSNPHEKLLSIGCGSGYVEYLLMKEGRDITAIEPSEQATKFLKQHGEIKLYLGFFPQCIDGANVAYDLAYMNAIDYCFNEKELNNILKSIYNFNIKKLMLISASWYHDFSLIPYLKASIKQILSALGLYELGQFWGYQRSVGELRDAIKSAGFKNIADGYLYGNQYWILGHKK